MATQNSGAQAWLPTSPPAAKPPPALTLDSGIVGYFGDAPDSADYSARSRSSFSGAAL